ncbi:4-carboxymuconolactone decarboxylase [Capsulimonas corticalis]|uniref:4-carboxymuconolactone decarboxylase n=1 Tax=Capsulimonas corticalis TaxID=2219043 RepID=A0A402CV44_9BACT|nr:carboxymuconolactone decarboxylase family protein [Capsulimonas corticalis]BDI30279.1 4-carboxymuconolactone decarboxylase [Capsulimonas corticalis]
MAEQSERYVRGMKLLDALHGGHAGKQMVMELGEICPEFVDMTIEWGFGEIASREGIDLVTRELVIIASCVTLGHTVPQLRAHIEAALHIGATKQQIVEVILQMSIYAGMANASNAFRTAKEVFAQVDAAA